MQKGFSNRVAIVSVYKKQDRPTQSPREAPRSWWRYVVLSTKPTLFRKVEWSTVKRAGEERRRYRKVS